MAYSIYGIGTTFYGKRDFRADGSFITTEWVSLIYFPILPLRSLRLRSQSSAMSGSLIGIGVEENYEVYQRTSPNLKQVIYVYGYALFSVGWIAFIIDWCVSIKEATPALTLLLVGSWVPVPIPWLLRYFARKRAYDLDDA